MSDAHESTDAGAGGTQLPADAKQTNALIDVRVLVQELKRQQPPPAPEPKPEPTASKWLKGLMPTFIVIFGFGGQITFTVIPTITKDDDVPSDWGAAKVRTFLSLAWMFFTLGFGLSCVMALAPVYGGDTFAKRLESEFSARFVGFLGLVLQLFACLAFLFLSLVVVAYTPAVGWVVVGFSSFAVLSAVISYIIDVWPGRPDLWKTIFGDLPSESSSGP